MSIVFDRYAQFRGSNTVGKVPFGKIPQRSSDIKIIFNKGEKRLDQISYQYYNTSDYAWLILQANPQYGALEYSIPDGVELRIPFPLESALSDYQKSIEEYNKYYN